MISHRQRMEACLAGEKPDRPPVALWRHFPVDDQTSTGLAAAHLNFQRTFDFDFLKVSPESSFCLKDWGARDEWRGATEGTRDYTYRVIQRPDDWSDLAILDPTEGELGKQLECLGLIVEELGEETPVIQTIFNPLSQAKNLVGDKKLIAHIRQYPEQVRAGLDTIVETTRRFVEAAKETGIAGLFFAVQHAQYHLLAEEEYREFGRAYDLRSLEPAGDLWLNLLHLHGEDIMFDLFKDYPIQIVNWHDRETPPTLEVGKKRFGGVVCGGIERHDTLVLGTPDQVTAEALDAFQLTGGERFILGTGCVVPIHAPYGNIMAARSSVDLME